VNVTVLHALVPTQKKPPLPIVQLSLMVLFAVLTTLATMKFHPERQPIL
jgi:hypothetical protein